MAIMAPDNTWTYVPFPGAVCMNGTPTGIGINKTSASKNLVIFMQGGNACFNLASCGITAHKDGYGPADIKEAKYARYGAAAYAAFGGIKVFLQHDPDPLSEAALLRITPRPALFVYQ